MKSQIMCEIWRGSYLESVHTGMAVICDKDGEISHQWGDPNALILPRSSAKMMQAIPLIISGAEKKFSIGEDLLALACASHNAAEIHLSRVLGWLSHLGFSETDLRCGPQPSKDPYVKKQMLEKGQSPCQIHNNCSGKHAGFLSVSRHLNAGPEYTDPDHPVQLMVMDVFQELTQNKVDGITIDGCSAPNPAIPLYSLAKVMSWFATAHKRDDQLSKAALKLRNAMVNYPELVAGDLRACTNLMKACEKKAILKTGAEGVFVAILPELEKGVALKIFDGGTRASECAIASLLIQLGVLNPNHPTALAYTHAPILNWRKIQTGMMKASNSFKI
ncbi:MAG: asparaginase [Rhodobacterales bacterium]|nr:asparaginase [Rhodobacterales bacterium]